MRRILPLIFFAGLCCLHTEAQQKKAAFRSINSALYFIGQSRDGWGFQTVNGIAYKNYFSGIGVGADYYYYNSYPLFFDQRIYIGDKRMLFGYGDLGYNFNNGNNKPNSDNYGVPYHFTGGLYADVGIGVRFPVNRKVFINFSGGFAYKRMNLRERIYPLMVFCDPCTPDYANYQYDNRRVDLKAGIDF